ncbi:MAG: ABC transporter ATP-binding protein [bacterium]|nr:ABC transporter ATP-binding protein [bacterium]
MMDNAFELKEMVKSYPKFQLGPLDLSLEPGTVMGYIGPNGSGKTTTINCLAGLIKADKGETTIFGKKNEHKNPEWKFDIGYVGETHVFYENWTGAKNLKFLSKFYPAWSDELVNTLIQKFDVPVSKRVKDLSKGNRAKLAIVSALAHSPRLLLLDEPTSGLDPVVRSEVLDVLFEVVESEERAIFYSTHILSDISRLADDLAFLVDGKIKMKAAKDDLIENWRQISFRMNKNQSEFKAGVSHKQDGREYQVVSTNFDETLEHLRELGAENIQDNRLSIDEIAVHILKGENNG